MDATEVTGNIGKFSQTPLARELYKLKLKDIHTIKIKGANRVCVEFQKYELANKFVENKTLIERVSSWGSPRNNDKSLFSIINQESLGPLDINDTAANFASFKIIQDSSYSDQHLKRYLKKEITRRQIG
ncbi:unnamed protein product [Brassicogethes aeneus]|uniref:Uncharacterized protein n=1 Tax=Brassicogethes aeneus TaxID=1431903 RepID=A0A9P0B4N3_BRAAE|nr:unnamed protein product [Brassicogethes aeneus]